MYMLGKTVTVRDEMKIKDVDNNLCIVELHQNELSDADLCKFKDVMHKNSSDFRFAFDLKNLKTVSFEFLNQIKSIDCTKKMSLFSVNNDILLLIYILKMERDFDIYISEQDCIQSRIQIVRRRLKVVAA